MNQLAAPPQHVDLTWDDDNRFHVKSPSGAAVVLDGQRRVGLSPMENLLASLCGCMATDVVNILRKMRADIRGLSLSASGEQSSSLPRRYRRINIRFAVTGDVSHDRVERAVQLSFQTYCSVFHSLRSDIEFTHTIEISK